MRSRRARDRRALTGEANNASRRKVMVVATARSPEWTSAWRTPDESGPNLRRFHFMQDSEVRTANIVANIDSNACCTVFFKQNFRNDFYPLDKANTGVNIGLRSIYNKM